MPHPHWQIRSHITTPGDVISPEAALQADESATLMNFPKQVILTTNQGQRVLFKVGPNPVPARLINHPYLAANGAVLIDVPAAPGGDEDDEPAAPRSRRGR